MTIKLSGLAEALLGVNRITVKNQATLLKQFPILKSHRSKLTFKKNLVTGFVACDG